MELYAALAGIDDNDDAPGAKVAGVRDDCDGDGGGDATGTGGAKVAGARMKPEVHAGCCCALPVAAGL